MQTWQQSAVLLLPAIPLMLGTQQKIMSLLSTFKKTHFRIIPIKGCSSFIDCEVWRHESECVKTIYLNATEFLMPAVNMYVDATEFTI